MQLARISTMSDSDLQRTATSAALPAATRVAAQRELSTRALTRELSQKWAQYREDVDRLRRSLTP